MSEGGGTVARDNQDDTRAGDRLGEIFRTQDGPPPEAIELAKLSFGLRSIDAELAALVVDADLDSAVSVRAGESDDGTRLLTFEVADPTDAGEPAAVEVEISGAGRGRRLFGQLHPPAP